MGYFPSVCFVLIQCVKFCFIVLNFIFYPLDACLLSMEMHKWVNQNERGGAEDLGGETVITKFSETANSFL